MPRAMRAIPARRSAPSRDRSETEAPSQKPSCEATHAWPPIATRKGSTGTRRSLR